MFYSLLQSGKVTGNPEPWTGICSDNNKVVQQLGWFFIYLWYNELSNFVYLQLPGRWILSGRNTRNILEIPANKIYNLKNPFWHSYQANGLCSVQNVSLCDLWGNFFFKTQSNPTVSHCFIHFCLISLKVLFTLCVHLYVCMFVSINSKRFFYPYPYLTCNSYVPDFLKENSIMQSQFSDWTYRVKT